MSNYAEGLVGLSDEQLVQQLSGGPFPGSQNFETIRFEMERRLLCAQKEAAEASKRASRAAERYTTATWILIIVTVIFNVMGVLDR